MSLGCGIFWNWQYSQHLRFPQSQLTLSHRDKEMWVVPRLARKRGMGNVKGTVEYRSPVCRARICRKSPLIFQHPSFILARRNNRHHFRVSSCMMPMPPGYTKVFGFAPTWCTKKIPRKKLRGIFYCCFPESRSLVRHRGREELVYFRLSKTLVGAGVARPCPFVYEITSPENAFLR